MDVKPPAKLGTRGRRFWRSVVAEFELSVAEAELLTEACRTIDTIDALQQAVADDGVTVTGSMGQTRAHPALSQLTASRALLTRLLSALDLPDEDGKTIPTATRTRAQRAAKARWAGHDKSTAERNHRKSNVVRMPGGSSA